MKIHGGAGLTGMVLVHCQVYLSKLVGCFLPLMEGNWYGQSARCRRQSQRVSWDQFPPPGHRQGSLSAYVCPGCLDPAERLCTVQRRRGVQSAVVPAARQRRAALGPDLRAVRRARGRPDRAARERVWRGGHGELAGVGRPPLGGLGAIRATPCACPSVGHR